MNLRLKINLGTLPPQALQLPERWGKHKILFFCRLSAYKTARQGYSFLKKNSTLISRKLNL